MGKVLTELEELQDKYQILTVKVVVEDRQAIILAVLLNMAVKADYMGAEEAVILQPEVVMLVEQVAQCVLSAQVANVNFQALA
jgi:hypothetical protein